ncbi:hypothetical protein OH799_11205 [Nocardia sp. NBC_00881]|nr:hypothetical protein OH799_11205 [Nocardia sp. NBC_00881]
MSAPEPAAAISAADFLAQQSATLPPIRRAERAGPICGEVAAEPGAGQ